MRHWLICLYEKKWAKIQIFIEWQVTRCMSYIIDVTQAQVGSITSHDVGKQAVGTVFIYGLSLLGTKEME